ncbi:hypothetical protein BKA93DRAFT_928833 [Sparassis latifolia]
MLPPPPARPPLPPCALSPSVLRAWSSAPTGLPPSSFPAGSYRIIHLFSPAPDFLPRRLPNRRCARSAASMGVCLSTICAICGPIGSVSVSPPATVLPDFPPRTDCLCRPLPRLPGLCLLCPCCAPLSTCTPSSPTAPPARSHCVGRSASLSPPSHVSPLAPPLLNRHLHRPSIGSIYRDHTHMVPTTVPRSRCTRLRPLISVLHPSIIILTVCHPGSDPTPDPSPSMIHLSLVAPLHLPLHFPVINSCVHRTYPTRMSCITYVRVHTASYHILPYTLRFARCPLPEHPSGRRRVIRRAHCRHASATLQYCICGSHRVCS